MTNTEKLLKRIKELNMTQHELAAELGIKQSTLSLKINNRRPFYLTEAFKLAKLLKIEAYELGDYFFYDSVA